MNGTFKVTMSTPMGPKSGRISFMDQNGVLSGSIRFMGNENPFRNGKTSGNNIEFRGALNVGFSRFGYTARGTVTGDTLAATANTQFGVMQISGTRIQDN
jgi:hypothetical protein